MTGGPKVMLGTKWPSITSRWTQSAPAATTASTSSPRREKSADRIDGEIVMGRVILWLLSRQRGLQSMSKETPWASGSAAE
jgi:hypothetical protein